MNLHEFHNQGKKAHLLVDKTLRDLGVQKVKKSLNSATSNCLRVTTQACSICIHYFHTTNFGIGGVWINEGILSPLVWLMSFHALANKKTVGILLRLTDAVWCLWLGQILHKRHCCWASALNLRINTLRCFDFSKASAFCRKPIIFPHEALASKLCCWYLRRRPSGALTNLAWRKILSTSRTSAWNQSWANVLHLLFFTICSWIVVWWFLMGRFLDHQAARPTIIGLACPSASQVRISWSNWPLKKLRPIGSTKACLRHEERISTWRIYISRAAYVFSAAFRYTKKTGARIRRIYREQIRQVGTCSNPHTFRKNGYVGPTSIISFMPEDACFQTAQFLGLHQRISVEIDPFTLALASG